jgi:PPOX class probable FMN-dependent enzyme
MTPGASHQIGSLDELREHYRPPGSGALAKQLDHLEEHNRSLIARSTLVMVATSDGDGHLDVSPRGGPAGWVTVLDDHHLAIPDLSGNNRLDTLSNIVVNGGIGLLFIVPGMDETLRINGTAIVTTAPDVLDRVDVAGRPPRTAIVVEVHDAYIHCAKAFRRAAAWTPDEWPDRSGLATVGCMFRDQMGLTDIEGSVIDERLEAGYEVSLWEPGGTAPSGPTERA